MRVDNLDIADISIDPFETNPPLWVYSDAILPFPITRQGFEQIGRWNPQILYCRASMKHLQLSIGDLLDVRRQSLRKLSVEYLFRFFARKAFDHIEHQV